MRPDCEDGIQAAAYVSRADAGIALHWPVAPS
jgi:hypothetical protein